MSLITQLFSARGKVLVLDGAMATELEKMGADLNDPLWSCKTLMEHPDLIRAVHLAYFQAGADIAITASYQATAKGLLEQKGLPLEAAKELIRESVVLAKSARDEIVTSRTDNDRIMLIAGSVGPYGACLADGSEYRGDYNLPLQDMKAFHRSRIEALVEAGADILALETMPNLSEIQALMELLKEEFPETLAYVSCSLKDVATICDGTPLTEVYDLVKTCPSIFAFGVNCCPPEMAKQALQLLASSSIADHALIAYPNSGEIWDASNNTWGIADSAKVINQTGFVIPHEYKGRAIIGGCCRTGPAEIQTIRDMVDGSPTCVKSSQRSE